MIGTEEYNNEIIRMNEASIICANNKWFKSKSFSEQYIKFCSYENFRMVVKGGLKQKKRQDIDKVTRSHYHLQKNKMFNT